ncbi:hypothetical protein C5I89_16270 [Enterobacter hormaechei]|nr:hypothetical protein C5I89_16270 [Enterobacter hormaechei]
MGSCAAPSAKGDDKFITTDYLQQCPQKCRIIQQEYDTKTLKMFHFTINMFQFVNLKELLQSINSLKI